VHTRAIEWQGRRVFAIFRAVRSQMAGKADKITGAIERGAHTGFPERIVGPGETDPWSGRKSAASRHGNGITTTGGA
jgi:hypothetical protein